MGRYNTEVTRRALYQRRRKVKELRDTGLTHEKIADRLGLALHQVRNDLESIKREGLPPLDDLYTVKELAQLVGFCANRTQIRVKAFGVKPAAVYGNTFYYDDAAVQILNDTKYVEIPSDPKWPRRERKPKYPRWTDEMTEQTKTVCAKMAEGMPFETVAETMGLELNECKRLLSRARHNGVDVTRMTTSAYVDVMIDAIISGRRVPKAPKVVRDLTARVIAYQRGVPVNLVATPGESVWSPEQARREVESYKDELHKEEYEMLCHLAEYKAALWKMRVA